MFKRAGGRGTKAGESALMGGQVFFHPCPFSLIHQPWWILHKGRDLISTFAHDVMTVHEYPPFYNGVGAIRLARTTGIPYALEVHHIVGYPGYANMKEFIGRIMSRIHFPIAVRNAKAVRAVSLKVKEKLVEWGAPEKKIKIVPSFYLDKGILTSQHAPPVIYDVSFCARLVPNKGLKELIQAIGKLSSARLVVIGSGPERERCEKLSKSLGLENRVTFLGWLPNLEAVIGAILSSYIFVMPSKSEGGPRSLLEAMACGMPVISTRVGVAPEVIKEGVNGIFTTGTPDDMAQKIRMLLNDELLRKKMSAEATKILEKYERNKCIEDYANFLKSLTS